MLAQLTDSKLYYLVGEDSNLDSIENVFPREVFDDLVIEFLDALSNSILNDQKAREYPDVLTFGFWCRKSNLLAEKNVYKVGLQLGRGLVFHITPSNLPIIFAYSMAAGLLSGNANVIKLPGKEYQQVEYMCRLLNEILKIDRYNRLRLFITCIRYESVETEITKYLSKVCNVRIIWGSDKSISDIRAFNIKSKASELVFPDRYSLCVIDSDQWLACGDKKRQARGFYTDTYLNDQNACSSAQMILWLGDEVQKAREDFWFYIAQEVKDEYFLDGFQSLLKLEHFYRMVEKFPDLKLDSEDNYIVRVWAPSLTEDLLNNRPGGGFFIESSAKDLMALVPLLGKGCQTISYFGLNRDVFSAFLRHVRPFGVDRIVPIGKALDFSLTWDGHDLIRTLSRTVNIS